MTLNDVMDVIHETPGIVDAFITETQNSEQRRAPVRNSGGGFEKQIVRNATFRVWLNCGDGRFAEREKATLAEALREAFAAVKLPVPDALAFHFEL